MVESLIVLKDLSKKFGKKIATSKISMSVRRGEIFGFLGANGAGKTTTIRMLCGLTKPTSGTGSIGGLDIWKDRFRIRSRFGYVPQKFSLYADLTVMENLRFFGEAYGVPSVKINDRIDKVVWRLQATPGDSLCANPRADAAFSGRTDRRLGSVAPPANLGPALRI